MIAENAASTFAHDDCYAGVERDALTATVAKHRIFRLRGRETMIDARGLLDTTIAELAVFYGVQNKRGARTAVASSNRVCRGMGHRVLFSRTVSSGEPERSEPAVVQRRR